MRLLHKEYQFMFSLKENSRNLLIVENPKIFSDFIQEILLGIEGEECNFILSQKDKLIKIQDYMNCIINPFALSINERKLINKLYDTLKKEILASELLLENNEIYSMIDKYGIHISQMSDWEIVYSDKMEVNNLLKFMDIKFAETYDTLTEKIIQYINVAHKLLGVECFLFVHLLSYLNSYEVEKLYEFVEYQKIHILLLESNQPNSMKEYNQVVIVDKDGCEINLNMS